MKKNELEKLDRLDKIDKVLRTVSENDIMTQFDNLALRDVRHVGFFINNYCNHYSVKLRKLREGVAHTSELLASQSALIKRSKEARDTKRLEILQLNKQIARSEQANERIRNQIKRESAKASAYESSLTSLRNEKSRVLKLRKDICQDIDFMKSAILSMQNQYDTDLVKYKKVLEGKDKFKNETTHFKMERRSLEHHLKELRSSEDQLITNMQKLVYNINKEM